MSAMGHKQTSRDVRVTSALPPIADILRMSWHVRFVPIADVSPRRTEGANSRSITASNVVRQGAARVFLFASHQCHRRSRRFYMSCWHPAARVKLNRSKQRQATETAVSAAISTPVFASTLVVASTRIPAGSSPWLQPSRTRYLNGHYLRAASRDHAPPARSRSAVAFRCPGMFGTYHLGIRSRKT
jgi:hypothetical protein